MTRLKKLLVAGLMVIVTGCASIGSALLNMTQSIFSWVRASANSYKYENKHDGAVYKDGDIVTVKNIPSRAKKDVDTIYIPRTALTTSFAGASTTAAETIVEIKNPYGASLTDTSIAFNEAGHILDAGQLALGVDETGSGGENHSGEYALTPNQAGVYTVQYAVKNENGVWTVSETYEIFVTADSYDIQFQANDPIVMPDKIDTSNDDETTVKIKLPLVYDKNGEQIKEFVLGELGTSEYYVAEYVTLNNVYLDDKGVPAEYTEAVTDKNKYDEFSTYKITRKTGAVDTDAYPYGLIIEVSKPGNSNNTQSNSFVKTANNMLVLNTANFEQDAGYYTDAAYTFEAVAGKNIVTYKLCKSTFEAGATLDAYVSYTIDGSSTYNSKVDLGISTSTTVKNSDVSINEKCYLPKVNAVDKNANKNTVNAFYSYKVAYVDTSAKKDVYYYGDKYVTMGVDEKGVYFIPRYLEEGTSDSNRSAIYNISYTATDFYGNKDKNVEDYNYDVTVRDNTSPSLYFVKSYDLKLDENNHVDSEGVDMNDYSYAIPSKYVIKEGDASQWTKIPVPAVFTKDNYNTFDQLKVTRVLTSENGFIGKSKNYEIKIQDTDGSTSTTDAGIITFEDHTATNYYVSDNKFYNNENVELAAKSAALKQAKTSTVAYINIDPSLFGEGEYTIEYSSQDYRYSNNSGKTFTFTLVKDTEANVDSTAPVVEFGTSTVSNVGNDQKITIKVPEIKDEVDTRLLKKYFVVAGANRLEITPDEDNNLVFNTSKEITTGTSIYDAAVASAEKSFKVYAVAVDDFGAVADWNTFDFNATDNIGVDSFEISVKYTEDDLAPTIVGAGTVKTNYVCDDCGHEQKANDVCAECGGTDLSAKIVITENEENKQFTTINAHGIKFYDNTNSAYVTVKVLNSKGIETNYEELPGSYVKKVAATDISTYIAASADKTRYNEYVYEYNFAGIKFLANDADNYTIVYTIVDGGNNTTTYSYVIRQTVDAQAPSIAVSGGTTYSLELGKKLPLNDINISDNKTAAENIEIEAVVELAGKGNRDSYFNAESKVFAPREVGVYTITITATDADDNSTVKTITVNVQDTNKPVVELDKMEVKTLYDENEIIKEDNSTKVKEYPTVTLPGFAPTDVYPEGADESLVAVLGAKGTLTITTPSDKVYVIDQATGNVEGDNPLNLIRKAQTDGVTKYNFYFTPTERGEYVASYVAEDNAGNKSEVEKITIDIGDTEVPGIYLTSQFSKLLNKGFVVNGDALVINTEARVENSENYKSKDLYVTDNFGFKTEKVYKDEAKTELDYEYVKVSVSVTNSNNNSIKSETDGNNVIYKFDTKGTYTITFTVTDSVGKVGTFTKSFKVTADEASSTDATQIIGTVLIIVSIVILAGVVIYFVRGTKLLPKKSKKAKNKKD